MNHFDPSGERSIAAYNESERLRRKSTPNLWKVPKMTPDLPPSAEEQLKKYQQTYTELLYSVGEKKYNLRPGFDFTVDIVLPFEQFSNLAYQIIGGAVVHVSMAVCSVDMFEERIHIILRQVKERLRTKSLDIRTELIKRDEEIKKIVPPFVLYEQLEGHSLEITIERIVTITDKDTKVTVSRTKKETQEPTRLMIHRAKMELIEVNGLVKELEAQSKEETYAQQTHEV